MPVVNVQSEAPACSECTERNAVPVVNVQRVAPCL